MQQVELLYKQVDDTIVLYTPMVGFVSELPNPGTILVGGECVGKLQCITTVYELILPKKFSGRIAHYDTELKIRNVQYAEELFKLLPIQAETATEALDEQKENNTTGKYAITSPTDGIFYRRPSPDSPAYVNEGDVIKKGQVLGLVEVMKCFNQILFQGLNLPDEVRVKEICVSDASEVKYGQNLFIFE